MRIGAPGSAARRRPCSPMTTTLLLRLAPSPPDFEGRVTLSPVTTAFGSSPNCWRRRRATTSPATYLASITLLAARASGRAERPGRRPGVLHVDPRRRALTGRGSWSARGRTARAIAARCRSAAVAEGRPAEQRPASSPLEASTLHAAAHRIEQRKCRPPSTGHGTGLMPAIGAVPRRCAPGSTRGLPLRPRGLQYAPAAAGHRRAPIAGVPTSTSADHAVRLVDRQGSLIPLE